MSGFVESPSGYEEQFRAEESQAQESRASRPPSTADDCGGLQSNSNEASGGAELLRSYEERFAHRFTSADEAYQQYVRRASDPPPIVEDWRGRRGGHDEGHREQRPYRGHDRRRGWSGTQWGPQQRQDRGWSQVSGRGYHHSDYRNSYNQRPPHSRY